MIQLKKPKFWDYTKPNFLSYLLLPFTIPVIINNFFLNLKNNKIIKQNTKKICIGNIYVGGTAKTPLTIKIYQILDDLGFEVATIKKYYKDQIDEQKILSEKTKMYCFKSRREALDEAVKDNVSIAIFDDGLQDKSMNYDIKFVCFNNTKCIGNGFLIPAGPLREKIDSVSKYDVAFINGNENENHRLKLLIKKYNKSIEIFESHYKTINLSELNINDKYLIFSGIGNPESFKETLLENKFSVIKEIVFPDHYKYTQADIDEIKSQAKKFNAKILTTKKDFVKINSNENTDIKFLDVELDIKDKKRLINFLKLHI